MAFFEQYRLVRIPSAPDYYISRGGTVVSIKHGKQRIVSPCRTAEGYIRVNLCILGKNTQIGVHRLLLETFVGQCPLLHECRHLDGNPSNNTLNNLRWGTDAENAADKIRHGRVKFGCQVHTSRLTPTKVRTIRKLAREGKTRRELASIFGIAHQNITRLVNRETWRRVA